MPTRWIRLWEDIGGIPSVGLLFDRCWLACATWRHQRNGWFLLQGIPAILVFLAAGTLAFLVGMNSTEDLKADYQPLAEHHLRLKNFPAACVAYERLSLLDPDRPDVRHGLAVALEGVGQTQRGWALMRSLVSRDTEGGGYGPAHFWLAQSLLSRPTLSPQDVEAAEAHLLQALAKGARVGEAHALLGQLYLKTDRPAQAEHHLLRTPGEGSERALFLSHYYTQQGKPAAARAWSEQCARFFRAAVAADPADNRARINWAEALILLGRHQEAVDILRQGLLRTGAQAYRARLADTYALWVKSLAADPTADLGRRLMLITEGARHDPNNVELVKQLATATKIEGPDANRARDSLEELLAQGTAPGCVHLFLGLDAWRHGQAETARVHLDTAYRVDPQIPVLANNLALLLAASDPAQLEQALEIIQTAVERQPQVLLLRVTRGKILARMHRWQEALDDLQPIAAALPSHRELHSALADVYDHLNLPEQAAAARRRAESKGP